MNALANSNDGCGNEWWERGRLSAWMTPRTFVFGLEFSRDERSFLIVHLGPLWVAWETTR